MHTKISNGDVIGPGIYNSGMNIHDLIEHLTERVERLLTRHHDLQRAHSELQQEIEAERQAAANLRETLAQCQEDKAQLHTLLELERQSHDQLQQQCDQVRDRIDGLLSILPSGSQREPEPTP